MRRITAVGLCVGLAGLVAACGNTTTEQAVLGVGAGTAASVVAGGSVATGAVLGAAGNVAYCKAYPSRCQ
ncbi:hypothetical protein [Salinihabitans flavidus]|uniref:hypothetical protein n=1 Tax=Salinihabitans flavidus TaxID=569882 RepID=UPI000B81D373|nr:hypothetical protein [Salinihabitans flavidus]